ncbi:ABC transporter [Reticulibacter mediterranei]|uniref:ABC transporter n=1 Tax=Reticulibacter mediterranei TaxID=2778369 RepID=A0A8J3N0S4_9CHLR|nr:sugar ABC transporter permease [Reticulibacter mediterranei]GHO90587.1 ABC transporter [Reticulibacter mediterranei]
MALSTERQVVSRATSARQASRRWSRYSRRTFYLFLAPWLLGFIILTIFPMIYAFLVSFTNFDGASPHWHWIGLANYSELLQDSDTWYSLSRTILYTVIVVPVSVVLGLLLALLVNRQMRGISVFRTIFYMPAVVPIVGSVVIWKIMFDRDAGAINAILQQIGGPTITWLSDPTAFIPLIVVVLWGVGTNMIISLAGLQGVPVELREASRVDGANATQSFWTVSLPILTPVLFFEVITGIITALQTLIQPLLLAVSTGTATAVSVPRTNYLYMINVYAQYFYNQRFGYASALLWVLFAIVLVITLLVFRSSTAWVYYEVDQEGGN